MGRYRILILFFFEIIVYFARNLVFLYSPNDSRPSFCLLESESCFLVFISFLRHDGGRRRRVVGWKREQSSWVVG